MQLEKLSAEYGDDIGSTGNESVSVHIEQASHDSLVVKGVRRVARIDVELLEVEFFLMA